MLSALHSSEEAEGKKRVLSEASCGKEKKKRKKKSPAPPVLPPPLSSAQLSSAPLCSALLLTEIASEAGPTKNSLDFTRTFRTIVFAH